MKTFTKWQHRTAIAALATMAMAPIALHAAQLSGDARASIPRDVQQIIVVDYRQMQNSPAAMQLKDRVLPPELKHLETALKNSGLQVDQDADTLAFAAFRTSGAGASGSEGTGTRILGVAQGQFNTQAILAKFAKEKTKATMLRNNAIYPMGSGGMSVAFLNQTTMVFGDREAVRAALDARDGLQPNFLQNNEMMAEMPSCRFPGGLEHSRPEGHPDHDEERSRRGRWPGGLRYGQKPYEGCQLHDGFQQWRSLQHVRRYVGHDYRSYGRDDHEGRRADEEVFRIRSGEGSRG